MNAVVVALVNEKLVPESAVVEAKRMYDAALPKTFKTLLIVVEPVLSIAKSVEVAHCAVEDENAKRYVDVAVDVGLVKILKSANGLVVPMPMAPVEVMVVVAVAPKYAALPV